jgi:hypothetical protein
MLHHKGSGSARHARISLVALGVAATAAAAFVAATAIPAYANGSHGNSGSKGNSASHSQSASHRQDTGHSQKGLHGNNGSQGSTGARGNSANAHEHVTICHATPPDTAANGYVEISPSAAGVYNGHLKEHAADIIPPFTYSGQTYSLNWDAAGQAIFANGCVAPSPTTQGLTLPNITLPNLTLPVSTGFVASAKASVKAMLAVLKSQTATRSGVLGAHKTLKAAKGGVLGAHKTLKGVAGRAHAVRAVTRSATFTG